MQQKKIKIYTYHGRYLKLPVGKVGHTAGVVLTLGQKLLAWLNSIAKLGLKFLVWIGTGLIEISFQTGSAIIHVLSRSKRLALADFEQTRHVIYNRLKLAREVKFSRALIMFLIIAGVGWVGVGTLGLIAKAL